MFETQGPLKSRQFDMGMYTWLSQADPNRDDYINSRSIPSQANNFAGNNYMGYRNPKADELSSRGAALITDAERKPVYCELQKIWTDDLPVLPLYQRVATTVARVRLQNYRPTPSVTPETWNIYEWSLA